MNTLNCSLCATAKKNVRIWVKDSGNIINELLLLVGSPDEFVVLSLTGTD
ncbi:MAG: DUF4252 domain-containing protein [Lewinellaceae bacterium]|nr:DUF4252 domain-containing protein [Lewinellaceae bacterium]